MSAGRAVAALWGLLAVGGCTDREVRVSFYTPAECCHSFDGGASTGLVCSDCPMSQLRSVRLTIERPTGEIEREACAPAPTGVCDYEAFRDLSLIQGVAPLEAVDLRFEGFYDDSCGGGVYFRCASPGQGRYLVDLREEGFPVDLWCSCAPLP